MSKESGTKRYALDIMQRTLQNGPPIVGNPESPLTYRNLILRPEDIGVLLTGLDQQEFREVLCGMFFVFDFGNATVNFYKQIIIILKHFQGPNGFIIHSSLTKIPILRMVILILND